MRQHHALLQRQGSRGVALFISLVLLLMLTIVGVSAVQTTTLEVRMARNEHDGMLAFQAAELALRDGEAAVDALAGIEGFVDSGANGLWTLAPPDQVPRWQLPGVWGTDSSATVAAPTPVGVGRGQPPPRFMIEHLTSMPQSAVDGESPGQTVTIFRVTARGVGATENTVTMLQSTYGRVMAGSNAAPPAAARTGRLSWRELF